LSSDGKTAATGLSWAASNIQVSQNGGGEVNSAGTVTEVAGGLYYYVPTTGELATLGYLSLRVNNTACLQFVKECEVVSFDPFAMQTQFADALLARDITTVAQAIAAKLSLLTAILKSVSKMTTSSTQLKTYQTDGTTLQLTQAITTNAADLPIDTMGVGS